MTTEIEIDVSVENDVLSAAETVLQDQGLTASDAVVMLLEYVAREGQLPFTVKVANDITMKAMNELEAGKGKRFESSAQLLKDLGI
jgi:DNA-damage-inducible protein J